MRTFSICLVLACGIATAGCHSLVDALRTGDSGGSRENPIPTDPWVQEAGTEARTEHPPETIRDPLGLRDIFTSEKAQEIERNVGVGD
jgi:hypothetical protein